MSAGRSRRSMVVHILIPNLLILGNNASYIHFMSAVEISENKQKNMEDFVFAPVPCGHKKSAEHPALFLISVAAQARLVAIAATSLSDSARSDTMRYS